jgi:hypothetical protein
MTTKSLVFRKAVSALLAVTTVGFISARVAISQAQLDTAAIDSGLGRSGTMMPGGVYRVALPRSDLHVTLDGVALRPGFALGGYAVFKAEPQGTLVLGDIPVLESEVGPFEQTLQNGGFQVTALHNHLLRETPHVLFLHYMKVGRANDLAAGLKRALAVTKMPPAQPAAATTSFPGQSVIESGLSRKGTLASGVLAIGAPRAENVTMMGMDVPPAMGVGTAINFEDAGSNQLATTGDFVLTESEVPLVQQALKNHGVEVTALHHHMMGDVPKLYYMHFWAVNSPEALAAAFKDALSHVNVRAP